jgi:hypothetical protein
MTGEVENVSIVDHADAGGNTADAMLNPLVFPSTSAALR